jgi:adenylate kinase
VRLLLLAPPGAGKGTQGERLAAWCGARHIAAGDLLRACARDGGPLGAQIAACQARGDLVPDQIVLDVLTPAVVAAAGEGGYILDGFPRTLPQATAAADLAAKLGVSLDAAIYLHAPDQVLTRRLLDRAGRGGRSDDTADVIPHRLRVYAQTTGPLVPYYTERGILITVDADQPPDSVAADIQAWLSGLALPGGARLPRRGVDPSDDTVGVLAEPAQPLGGQVVDDQLADVRHVRGRRRLHLARLPSSSRRCRTAEPVSLTTWSPARSLSPRCGRVAGRPAARRRGAAEGPRTGSRRCG